MSDTSREGNPAVASSMGAYEGEAGRTTKARDRHGSQYFYSLLEEMAETHDRKSHDYASNSNPYGNYYFAGMLSTLFSHSEQDAGFIGRIGEKVYRLANLESSQKMPSNESIEDTERDIAVITCLWMASRRERRAQPNKLNYELFDLIKMMPNSQLNQLLQYGLELKVARELQGENDASTTRSNRRTD